MKGAFLSVDGADGSGKTTQLDYIQGWLTARGEQVVRTREPGGTALGALLRNILLENDGVPICGRAELLLFFADRAQHLAEVILPAIEAGKWVLTDRFTDATYAYQGGGRGAAVSDIETLEALTQGALQPDLTLLLDVSPAVSRMRVVQQDLILLNREAKVERARADRFEKESVKFNQAARKIYKQRAARFKGRIKLVNADQTIDQVRAEIATRLDAFWRKWRA